MHVVCSEQSSCPLFITKNLQVLQVFWFPRITFELFVQWLNAEMQLYRSEQLTHTQLQKTTKIIYAWGGNTQITTVHFCIIFVIALLCGIYCNIHQYLEFFLGCTMFYDFLTIAPQHFHSPEWHLTTLRGLSSLLCWLIKMREGHNESVSSELSGTTHVNRILC